MSGIISPDVPAYVSYGLILLVAVGCRHIFAGGVQGIVMPGQTPALWKPFEASVTSVARRIGARNKLYRDRFDA